MVSKFARMVNSAQRCIVVASPVTSAFADICRVVFEIQGIRVETVDREHFFNYTDMADHGVKTLGRKPLSFWQRLNREPAHVGDAIKGENEVLTALFWTEPALDLRFELSDIDQANLWKECHIMVRSAGFDLVH